MRLSDETKKQILKGFIVIFTRLADKEYQKRVWFRAEGPEIDDFDDTACDFFAECDSIIENYRDFYLSEHQYQLLLDFRNSFDQFIPEARKYPFHGFLDTPEWTNIIEKAQKIL